METAQASGGLADLPHAPLGRRVLGAAYEVHTCLGPGLLESSYRACLVHELSLRCIACKCEVPLPLDYKGFVVQTAYRADLVICDSLVVELKAVETISTLHMAQLLTYMRLLALPVGILINFNVAHLRSGIRRIVNRRALPPGLRR
jgi:GxxExxY protein